MVATTIEQSKHLLELGLDPKTADCMWLVTSRARLHVLDGEPISNYDRWENYPAWSLSALLEVMPKETLPALEYREGNKEWEANVWIHHNIHCISHYDKMCAVYSMVCWLLEQGLIEKGDNDDSKD